MLGYVFIFFCPSSKDPLDSRSWSVGNLDNNVDEAKEKSEHGRNFGKACMLGPIKSSSVHLAIEAIKHANLNSQVYF